MDNDQITTILRCSDTNLRFFQKKLNFKNSKNLFTPPHPPPKLSHIFSEMSDKLK